ncbi:hypothetical protein H8M03_05340 [Sphingomonas sabuli]|uniref:Uncharacterized protein n=1 Tax=Sphingomonas sabuli TaxID=2764186 RepID=A0A7G9L546_9SPHN|nr:hypothetical protein [Sphingomonas sabuli]QNM83745.1 hypothetical protein H8M03_05340 [Sphingomonas sabuli]
MALPAGHCGEPVQFNSRLTQPSFAAGGCRAMTKHIAIIACLLLAACSGEDVIENNSSGAEALPSLNRQQASATGDPQPPGQTSAPEQPAGNAAIPAALHGRWGLTPGDCTSTGGDNKGLLVVSADSLKFYESRAIPTVTLQTSPNSANGQFNFTGEGQEWQRYQALELQDDKLVRTERDPLETFTYARC